MRVRLISSILSPCHFVNLDVSQSWEEYFDMCAVPHKAYVCTGSPLSSGANLRSITKSG